MAIVSSEKEPAPERKNHWNVKKEGRMRGRRWSPYDTERGKEKAKLALRDRNIPPPKRTYTSSALRPIEQGHRGKSKNSKRSMNRRKKPYCQFHNGCGRVKGNSVWLWGKVKISKNLVSSSEWLSGGLARGVEVQKKSHSPRRLSKKQKRKRPTRKGKVGEPT